MRRFTEKPDLERAAKFVAAGNYLWNGGMFLWSARTLANAMREHLPRTAPLLEQIANTFGTRKFAGAFRRLYPQCENISIDYAVLEPRSSKGEQNSNIFCLPADFGWSGVVDCLARTPRLESKPPDRNLIYGEARSPWTPRGSIHAPGKCGGGVNNLVVAETDDAADHPRASPGCRPGREYLDEKIIKGIAESSLVVGPGVAK